MLHFICLFKRNFSIKATHLCYCAVRNWNHVTNYGVKEASFSASYFTNNTDKISLVDFDIKVFELQFWFNWSFFSFFLFVLFSVLFFLFLFFLFILRILVFLFSNKPPWEVSFHFQSRFVITFILTFFDRILLYFVY